MSLLLIESDMKDLSVGTVRLRGGRQHLRGEDVGSIVEGYCHLLGCVCVLQCMCVCVLRARVPGVAGQSKVSLSKVL